MSEARDLGSLIVPRMCSRCQHSTKEGNDLVCRRNPPQVTIVMVPAPPPRVGQIVPQSLAAFPVVRPDMWCGEYALAPSALS